MLFSQSDWTDDSLQEIPWVLVALMDFVCWKKPQNSCRKWLQLADNQQEKTVLTIAERIDLSSVLHQSHNWLF